MKYGLDFDNTICIYDAVLHSIFDLTDWAPHRHSGWTKDDFAAALREAGREDVWTTLQGYLYSVLIRDAQLAPGLAEFLYGLNADDTVLIVSHKTKNSASTETFDLRTPALRWIEKKLLPIFMQIGFRYEIHFLDTEKEKIEFAISQRLDVFIDDLPRVCSKLVNDIPLVFCYRNIAPYGAISLSHWSGVRSSIT